jgi:RIO-like serine/threonine protein kinase
MSNTFENNPYNIKLEEDEKYYILVIDGPYSGNIKVDQCRILIKKPVTGDMEFVIDCFSRQYGISVEKSINDLIGFEEKFKEIANSFKKKKSIPETDDYNAFVNGKFKKRAGWGRK